jgi:hypothetical protein
LSLENKIDDQLQSPLDAIVNNGDVRPSFLRQQLGVAAENGIPQLNQK